VLQAGHAVVGDRQPAVPEQAAELLDPGPVKAVIGGLHLFLNDDKGLSWTAGQLKSFGLQQLVGAHCTGIEAVFRIRDLAGLTRQACVVGAVGASYSLTKGINPMRVAK
jgi:7,8-dihydropterin-6-yl-methyl-4-(beta-D-ribofuranosyl)aminobenzene 5'-phosphate synthase